MSIVDTLNYLDTQLSPLGSPEHPCEPGEGVWPGDLVLGGHQGQAQGRRQHPPHRHRQHSSVSVMALPHLGILGMGITAALQANGRWKYCKIHFLCELTSNFNVWSCINHHSWTGASSYFYFLALRITADKKMFFFVCNGCDNCLQAMPVVSDIVPCWVAGRWLPGIVMCLRDQRLRDQHTHQHGHASHLVQPAYWLY